MPKTIKQTKLLTTIKQTKPLKRTKVIAEKVRFCGCGATKDEGDLCDGSHNNLKNK